jgi:plastocyanin
LRIPGIYVIKDTITGGPEMRRLFLAVAAGLALTMLGPATAADQTVTITRAGFVPQDVTINAGDTVTWRNTDTIAHQVVFDRAPCNLTIQPGASGSCTFRAGGRFSYQDPTQRPRLRGTVTVTGPRASVTLTTSHRTVTFAAPVTLSGFVSTQAANEAVVVQGQECGKPAFTRAGAATTTTGGRWTFVVRPTINTVYQARWRTNESTTVPVKVRPRIRLSRVGSRFTARVTAAQSFSGKTLLFQRYRPAVRRWRTLKRVTLGTATTPTAGTFVTTRRFRARVRVGWRLRVFLPQTQAGTCYVAGPSNTVRVR